MKTANAKDTFDHILGAGALSYSWYVRANYTEATDEWGNLIDPKDWHVTIMIETGDDDPAYKRQRFGHKDVLATARKILADNGPERKWGGSEKLGVSRSTRRECRNLIFDVDGADFDAANADELLQVLMLGEIVFA